MAATTTQRPTSRGWKRSAEYWIGHVPAAGPQNPCWRMKLRLASRPPDRCADCGVALDVIRTSLRECSVPEPPNAKLRSALAQGYVALWSTLLRRCKSEYH